jgi:hypothetical protein
MQNGSCVISIKQNINFNIPPNSTFIFLVFHNNGMVKICPSLDDLPSYNIFFSYRPVQVFPPSQKSEWPLFLNGWNFGIKNYGIEVTFNDMISLLNFIKIYCWFRFPLKHWQSVTRRSGIKTHKATNELFSLKNTSNPTPFTRREEITWETE